MATEKRLIDANEFLQWVVKRFKCVPLVGSCDNDFESMKLLLAQAPTVDAVEVVHGRWIGIGGNRYTRISQCSNCCAKYDFMSNYCPNCGAKMDGYGNE